MSGGHSGQADDGLIADRRNCFERHVAGSLDSPFVVLLKQDGADEPGDGGLLKTVKPHSFFTIGSPTASKKAARHHWLPSTRGSG
jgi:hypothetical protein